MEFSARQYLENEILGATPQKLRLMLLEAAARSARHALDLWGSNPHDEALASLIRCRSIVSELLSGIRLDDTELTHRVAGVYTFLFRSLTEAQLRGDRQKVDEVLAILDIECETWRLVCESLPHAPSEAGGGSAPIDIAAPSHGIGGPSASAFSLDA